MDHEYDQDRKHSPAAYTSHHDAVEPGQSSRSALLRRPEQPIASGLVQRKVGEVQAARAQQPFELSERSGLVGVPVQPMQRVATNAATGAAVGQALPSDGGGKAMPADVRHKMERAFGTDFSNVRIHEGPRSEALGALAYTQGTEVHFAPGQYQPDSHTGQSLLGHELAHVVQQGQGRVSATTQAKGVDVGVNDDAGLEREADEVGAKAARGERVDGTAKPGEATYRHAEQDTARWTIQRYPKKLDGIYYYDSDFPDLN